MRLVVQLQEMVGMDFAMDFALVNQLVNQMVNRLVNHLGNQLVLLVVVVGSLEVIAKVVGMHYFVVVEVLDLRQVGRMMAVQVGRPMVVVAAVAVGIVRSPRFEKEKCIDFVMVNMHNEQNNVRSELNLILD